MTLEIDLRKKAKLRDFMATEDLARLIHAFISSNLDYCNSLFTGLPKKAIKKLQLVQKAAASALTKTRRTDHITPIKCKISALASCASQNSVEGAVAGLQVTL